MGYFQETERMDIDLSDTALNNQTSAFSVVVKSPQLTFNNESMEPMEVDLSNTALHSQSNSLTVVMQCPYRLSKVPSDIAVTKQSPTVTTEPMEVELSETTLNHCRTSLVQSESLEERDERCAIVIPTNQCTGNYLATLNNPLIFTTSLSDEEPTRKRTTLLDPYHSLTEQQKRTNILTPNQFLKLNGGIYPEVFRETINCILNEQLLSSQLHSCYNAIHNLYPTNSSGISIHTYSGYNETPVNHSKRNKKNVSWSRNVEIWDTTDQSSPNIRTLSLLKE